jgi:hypothetical protein
VGQLVRILLRPVAGDHGLNPEALQSPERGSNAAWSTYAAAASTVGFGIVTAYFKHEANRNYDLYVSTDDPKYRDATKKYDRAAVWTLVITEMSFGLLAYLLLSE